MVSAVPDEALGNAAMRTLRGHGVDIRGVQRGSGRILLYVGTSGPPLRATDVIYGHSAFITAPPRKLGLETLLTGADKLHLSGISPALGTKGCTTALQAKAAATSRGIPISFDGNYGARL